MATSDTYHFIIGDRSAQESAALLEQLNVRSKEDLFAAIGAVRTVDITNETSSLSEQNGLTTVKVRDLRSIFDPGKFTQGPEQVMLGRRIFLRWSSALRDFICGSASEDQQLKGEVLAALSGVKGGGTAFIAVELSKQFGLEASIAALVAALTMRLLAKPAIDEICQTWRHVLEAEKL